MKMRLMSASPTLARMKPHAMISLQCTPANVGQVLMAQTVKWMWMSARASLAKMERPVMTL